MQFSLNCVKFFLDFLLDNSNLCVHFNYLPSTNYSIYVMNWQPEILTISGYFRLSVTL